VEEKPQGLTSESKDAIDSKFRFILIAAKRARQLDGGSKPRLLTTSHKSTRIAMAETRAGMVKYELMSYVKREDRLTQDRLAHDRLARSSPNHSGGTSR
jgi:DNA-directed RNA polymerase omega subunit